MRIAWFEGSAPTSSASVWMLAVVLAGFCAAAPAQSSATAGTAEAAATALVPFEATYTVTWKGMNAGNAVLNLRATGDETYTYTSRNLARGVFRIALPDAITQSSEFRVQAGRIVPLRYRGDDGSSDTDRDVALDFDWQSERVTGTAEDEPVNLPLSPGVQDVMSVQIAQMRAVAMSELPTSFKLADKDEIKEYEFVRDGAERVKTAVGEVDTLICVSRRPGSSRATRLWIAPSLGYLPVRAERRKADRLEFAMELEKLIRPAP